MNGDIEAKASAEDAATAEAGTEPWPELVADSRLAARDGAVDFPLKPPLMTRSPFKQDRMEGGESGKAHCSANGQLANDHSVPCRPIIYFRRRSWLLILLLQQLLLLLRRRRRSWRRRCSGAS